MHRWRQHVALRCRAFLHRPPKADVIRIYAEGAETFGDDKAEAYYADLTRVFDLLGDTPEMGRLRSELTPPMRIHPHGVHVIVYFVDADGNVHIVRVRHGREDWVSDPI